MVKILKVKERPLSLSELVHEASLVGGRLTEEEMKKRIEPCPKCGCQTWILLPIHSKPVKEGGKRYMHCQDCCYPSHL